MQAQSAAAPKLEATNREAASKTSGGWHLCGGSEAVEPTVSPRNDPHRKQKVSPLELAAAEQQAQNAQQQLANLQQQHQQCQQVHSHLLVYVFKTAALDCKTCTVGIHNAGMSCPPVSGVI